MFGEFTQVTMENSLVSGFMETCGHDLGIKNVAFLESCLVEGGNFQKLADLRSVHFISVCQFV